MVRKNIIRTYEIIINKKFNIMYFIYKAEDILYNIKHVKFYIM